MIVRIIRDWNGYKAAAIVEMGLQDGRRACEIGVADPASIKDVRQYLQKDVKVTPEDKMVRTVRAKEKKAKSPGRKKKPAGRSTKGSG